MRESEETISDKRQTGELGKLDKLYVAVLFRILAVLDVRVPQILPTFRVLINLPMSFHNKTVRVASDLRRFRKDSSLAIMSLS